MFYLFTGEMHICIHYAYIHTYVCTYICKHTYVSFLLHNEEHYMISIWLQFQCFPLEWLGIEWKGWPDIRQAQSSLEH